MQRSISQGIQIVADKNEMGKVNTLRYNVMVYVVEENYERAIEELQRFYTADSEYPRFKEKIEKYINYAIDLVNAIRAKRRFPGVHSLTMAKQQEIIDRFHEHFDELKVTLRRIEKVQIDVRFEDTRSTVILIRMIVLAVTAISIIAFILEGSHGMITDVYVVGNEYVSRLTDLIFQKLKF